MKDHLKMAKKVSRQAFRCEQYPKASQNLQHPTTPLGAQVLAEITNLRLTFESKCAIRIFFFVTIDTNRTQLEWKANKFFKYFQLFIVFVI